MLKVVLYKPEIPWNTGNIGRTCVALNAELHLIEPLGFALTEKEIRRSGLDYWKDLHVTVHPDEAAWLRSLPKDARVLAFASQGKVGLWDAPWSQDAWLLFGRESTGLPKALLDRFPTVRIPISGKVRSLNLSTAAAVALYEGARRGKGRP